MQINTVIQGDCLDVMRGMPDKSVDMILTDPPYGIDYLSSRTDNHTKIKNDDLPTWEALLPAWLGEMARIIKDDGVCCCCCCGGGKTPVSALFTIEFIKHFNLIQTVIWDKLTIGLGWRYRPSYETVIVGSKEKDKYKFYDNTNKLSNIVRFGNIIPGKDDHPTPKPVSLMSHFIKIHSLPGDVVLDPFSGGGTTAIACLKTNRNYICIEKEQKYVDIINERIKQETDQLKFAI